MKNQYVGDINDYVKYAFLRHLMSAGHEVAICWMLTRDDGRTDGSRRSYLDTPERYRHRDPELFDAFAGELRQARDVESVERSRILPKARFISGYVDDDEEARAAYLDRLFAGLAPKSLVFFDPDNGLDVASVRPGRRNSSKYLFRNELAATLNAGHSAIVYQHFPRVQRRRFVENALTSVACPTPLRSGSVYTSHVAYLLFLQEPHERVRQRAREFAAAWSTMLSYHDVMPDLDAQPNDR